MSYYKVLGLQKEPFSTSPDPSLFYLSKEHKAALYRLRISVKLKRGLCLILGDVGAGKTTLSRRFIQTVREEPNVVMRMILNPAFDDEIDFLREICDQFGILIPETSLTAASLLREIEHFLFKKGVDEGRSIVLLIDEAQKLGDRCLEVLRALLNYETNEYKILQLILVAQTELAPRLQTMNNFWDRISLKHVLHPLDFEETRLLIAYRLRMSGYQSPVMMFTEEAMQAVHRASRGFPRRITILCHDCLEHLVMHNRPYVDSTIVESLTAQDDEFSANRDPKGKVFDGSEARIERSDARRASV